MRFMTYNIKLGIQQGLRPIVDVIRRETPDVVALQEVGCNWRMGPRGDTTARIAHQTGLAHRMFVPTIHESKAVRYGHALLSRWPLRNCQRRDLTNEADEPRAVLSTEVVTRKRTWHVVSTHLSHLREERALQGPEFRHLLDERRANRPTHAPLVAMGDFNETRDMPAPWLRTILDEFDEACRLDDAPTFENPTPDQRIDYLLVDGARWSTASVLDEPTASDHRPVVTQAY